MSAFLSSPLAAFALTALIIEMTPGPNMAYLAALSLSQGTIAGLAAVAGVTLGLAICGVAAALGLGAIIDNSIFLYELLRWGGVIYLLWLAWDAWIAERKTTETDTQVSAGTAFRRGLITNLLNPKAAVFYIAVLPDFIDLGKGSIATQTLTLSAIYVGIATAVHLAIVLLAGQLQAVIGEPEKRRIIRRALALMLAAIAIWFAFSTAR